jgi:hypothetical protein
MAFLAQFRAAEHPLVRPCAEAKQAGAGGLAEHGGSPNMKPNMKDLVVVRRM